MSVDFGATAEDYAKFRAGFPESFFGRLEALGLCRSGTTVVDVGTGTGTLARGFARRGAVVVAIDPDDRLMHQARQLDASAGVSIDYRTGTAESLPLPDASADMIVAGQCWHWFDGPRAAREFARVAKPHGRVVAQRETIRWGRNPARSASGTPWVLSATQPGLAVLYSSNPETRLLPDRMVALVTTPPNSPVAALDPKVTVCASSIQNGWTAAEAVPRCVRTVGLPSIISWFASSGLPKAARGVMPGVSCRSPNTPVKGRFSNPSRSNCVADDALATSTTDPAPLVVSTPGPFAARNVRSTVSLGSSRREGAILFA